MLSMPPSPLRVLAALACAATALAACGEDRDDGAKASPAPVEISDAPADSRECTTTEHPPVVPPDSIDAARYERCRAAAAAAARALCAARYWPNSRRRPDYMDDATCAGRWLRGMPERSCATVVHVGESDWVRTEEYWPAADGLLARCVEYAGDPAPERLVEISCDPVSVFTICGDLEDRSAREVWCEPGRAIDRTPSGERVDCVDYRRFGTPAQRRITHTATGADSFRDETEEIPAYGNGGWARSCFDRVGRMLIDCLAE